MDDSRYHHGALREALLQRARETLRSEGAEALSLRRLARDLGVSHAAPGRHFKDRRALLDALALDGYERLATALEAAYTDGGAFRTVLTRQAAAYVDFAAAERGLVEVMYSCANWPTRAVQLTQAIERTIAAGLAPIRHAQEAGEVVAGDPHRMALVVATALYGLTARGIADTCNPDQRAEIQVDLVRYLVEGLTAR